MDLENLNTSLNFKSHRIQRDSARQERDTALAERDKARDDFKDQKTSFENDQSAQDQFIATLSHDLKNPISAIKMAVEVIRLNTDEGIRREMTDLIERNAEQAGDLIHQLLDVHLIRSGDKLPVKLESCELIEILEECFQYLTPEDRSKILLTSSAQTPVQGFWDPQALTRVFKNLISNALKFSGEDKRIRVTVAQGTEATVILVQNFGEVISLIDQLRIFDSHVRIPQTDGHKQGWGLGLTLVKGIVEAHQGKVEVTSNRIEGTTFTLSLPNDARIPV